MAVFDIPRVDCSADLDSSHIIDVSSTAALDTDRAREGVLLPYFDAQRQSVFSVPARAMLKLNERSQTLSKRRKPNVS
jgi:hypothetical protein